MAKVDKEALLEELRRMLREDLDALTASQLDAQAGATHSEAKAEGDKDMRATEVSYLARGLAKRVVELREAVATLDSMRLRSFAAGDTLALGAFFEVEDEEGDVDAYFMAPVAGGTSLRVKDAGGASHSVLVLTPSSPLGKAFVGRRQDDAVEVSTPQGRRELVLLSIS